MDRNNDCPLGADRCREICSWTDEPDEEISAKEERHQSFIYPPMKQQQGQS